RPPCAGSRPARSPQPGPGLRPQDARTPAIPSSTPIRGQRCYPVSPPYLDPCPRPRTARLMVSVSSVWQVTVTLEILVFVAGTAVSLSTSYLLITRLERIGERLGMSEALLGMVAALAADAPEITSAVTALALNQQQVGAGVIIGSNVFNLAAL